MLPRKLPMLVPLASLSGLRPDRDVQPGVPDKTKPRRLSAEVAAEKAAKALAKMNKVKVLSAGILAIFVKENEMAMEDTKTNLAADHLPAKTIKKVSRVSNLKAAAVKTVVMHPGTG
jgi:hypothetical protein